MREPLNRRGMIPRRAGPTFAIVAALLACAAPANAAGPDPRDPASTLVSELVIVALARGPAWWKASKGDSVVWILGLPTTRTPDGMKWDRSTLERRLKGARLMLAPVTEWSGFAPKAQPPVLPPHLARKVAAAAAHLGDRPKANSPITVATAMRLRFLYYRRNDFTHDTHSDIYRAALKARVGIVHPPVRRHYWRPSEVSPADPEIAACIVAIIEDVQAPPQRTLDAASAWAVGDVQRMLAIAPRGVGYTCRRFWPGHWERTIDFQTKAIAEALEKPGKVIAVVHTTHLVAQNGILQRLRAQGYTIADPAKLLTE